MTPSVVACKAPADARAEFGWHGHARAAQTTKAASKHASKAKCRSCKVTEAAAQVSPSVVTYNTLVDAYIKAGWHGRARAALEEARRAGVALDAWSYSPLVKGCCQAGDLTAALGLLAEMRAAGVVPNVVRAGLWHAAVRWHGPLAASHLPGAARSCAVMATRPTCWLMRMAPVTALHDGGASAALNMFQQIASKLLPYM